MTTALLLDRANLSKSQGLATPTPNCRFKIFNWPVQTYKTDMHKVDFQIQLAESEPPTEELRERYLPIHEEYFWLNQNGTKRKLRLHDYAEVYRIPYLYEHLMEKLHCQSYTLLPSLLIEQFTQVGGKVEDMVVLDIGAGSGMVCKTLRVLGVKSVTGIDILPEAAIAAERQYPGVYENYYVEDLTDLSKSTLLKLNPRRFNCLVCCSALSQGHVPADALSIALNAIAPNGWIAFNMPKYIWDNQGAGGLVQLHPWVAETDVLDILATHYYQHRIYMDGRSLEYVAIIGRKRN
ncbi:MAG: class I SAM-dependent methyltransferase [Microcoleaceae cyanobacterium]